MKTTKAIFTALLCAMLCTSSSQAAGIPPRKITVDATALAKLPATDQQRVLYIADRLETITNTDHHSLSRDERQALRAETKALKAEADMYNAAGGGTVVYISGAGLIIIILLLIILF
ncbi:MAG TPA: hypothetical protein PK760_03765 [Flavobacteriales bacterium]|nr:hypothetical protein [Flavobacteriales bacterium]